MQPKDTVMKLAQYWDKQKDKVVQCKLCPRLCVIKKGNTGFCRVRKNIDGKLYSLVYGKCVSTAIDPIEKKPFFHFLPSSKALSIGTIGCNLRCKHCQNWQISQSDIVEGEEYFPEDIVKMALENNCESIAYTYNDPVVFFEFVSDTAKLAKKKGLKNVIVSNGFINQEPLKEWLKYIDAANIDYKGDDKFYRDITTAWLKPVQETLKTINKSKTWLEITNLIIPTLNDKPKQIKDMCNFIYDELGNNIPLHFSRFFPYFQLSHLPPTEEKTLFKAKDIAKKTGMKYIYIGNMMTEHDEDTFCQKCGKLLIKRERFEVVNNNVVKGKCKFCKKKIDGVF